MEDRLCWNGVAILDGQAREFHVAIDAQDLSGLDDDNC